jgi:hypothetical protein
MNVESEDFLETSRCDIENSMQYSIIPKVSGTTILDKETSFRGHAEILWKNNKPFAGLPLRLGSSCLWIPYGEEEGYVMIDEMTNWWINKNNKKSYQSVVGKFKFPGGDLELVSDLHLLHLLKPCICCNTSWATKISREDGDLALAPIHQMTKEEMEIASKNLSATIIRDKDPELDRVELNEEIWKSRKHIGIMNSIKSGCWALDQVDKDEKIYDLWSFQPNERSFATVWNEMKLVEFFAQYAISFTLLEKKMQRERIMQKFNEEVTNQIYSTKVRDVLNF